MLKGLVLGCFSLSTFRRWIVRTLPTRWPSASRSSSRESFLKSCLDEVEDPSVSNFLVIVIDGYCEFFYSIPQFVLIVLSSKRFFKINKKLNYCLATFFSPSKLLIIHLYRTTYGLDKSIEQAGIRTHPLPF